MSLQALAQEKFWANKAECEDAEKAYHMRLSGAKVLFLISFFFMPFGWFLILDVIFIVCLISFEVSNR